MKKKQICLIGCGTGNPRSLSVQAQHAIHSAEIILGQRELLERLSVKGTEIDSAEDVRTILVSTDAVKIVILLFWNIECELGKEILSATASYRPAVLPGISPLSYLAARTGLSTENVTISFSGEATLLKCLSYEKEVFTKWSGHLEEELSGLIRGGLGNTEVWLMEDPGKKSERFSRTTVRHLQKKVLCPDSYFLFRRSGHGGGQPALFAEMARRSNDGMSEEIRESAIAALHLIPGDIIYDIGCGTGLLAAEAAVRLPYGEVIAVEKVQKYADAAKARARLLETDQMRVIHGEAPKALARLPFPSKAILEGTEEKIKELLQILVSRNPSVRVVILRRTIEGASEAVKLMETMNFHPTLTEMHCSHTRLVDGRHQLTGEPPCYILSGTHEPVLRN